MSSIREEHYSKTSWLLHFNKFTPVRNKFFHYVTILQLATHFDIFLHLKSNKANNVNQTKMTCLRIEKNVGDYCYLQVVFRFG